MSEQDADTPEGADDLAAAQAAEQAEAARAAYAESSSEEPADADATDAVPPAGTGPAGGAASSGTPDEDDPRSREQLIAALADVEHQRDEYLKDVQRLQAEFENFRKRTMREGATQRAAGVVELTGKLLDVLDDFDMALRSGETHTDVEALHKGVELVYRKLIAVLKSAGLERIDDQGELFDPEKHEAVQQVPAEDGPLDEPLVAEVLRPGYQMQGRVIRAAMVKVEQ